MKNKYILGLLVLLFIAPGLLAYLYYLNPNWITGTHNKGHFLNPAESFPVFSDQKWRLIYWTKNGCEQTCIRHLDELQRLRLALGRRYYEVDLWLLQPKEIASSTKMLPAMLQQHHIQVLQITPQQYTPLLQKDAEAILIANPTQYLVLAYQPNAPLDDIFHDIKHLLTTSTR